MSSCLGGGGRHVRQFSLALFFCKLCRYEIKKPNVEMTGMFFMSPQGSRKKVPPLVVQKLSKKIEFQVTKALIGNCVFFFLVFRASKKLFFLCNPAFTPGH